jgi:hypothetical protein
MVQEPDRETIIRPARNRCRLLIGARGGALLLGEAAADDR